MKTMLKVKIGDYCIIHDIGKAAIDLVKTERKVAPLLKQGMSKEEKNHLFMDNLVYADVGPEAVLISDDLAIELQQKLDEIGENQLLLDNGEYIPNFYNVEYHVKKSGKWEKVKIEEIGVALPKGAVLQDNLTTEQREEIATQAEEARIANLTPEKKAEELETRLHTLAREAINKAEEAELLRENFDKITWLQPKIMELEEKYA